MSKRIMTEEEIVRWIRRFQHDPEFRQDHEPYGSKTVPLGPFCRFAGIRRATVYELLRRRRTGTFYLRQRLTLAIEAVQEGLRWQKTFQGPTIMVGPKTYQEYPRAKSTGPMR